MKIVRVATSGKGYGGNIYEQYIDRVFADNSDYKVVQYQFKLKKFWRVLELPLFIYFCWSYSRNDDFFVIRNFNTSFFPFKNTKNGVTLIYHIDETGSGFLVSIFQKFLEKAFFIRKDYNETVVVIAEYWRQFFLNLNYKNVELIYCPYDIEKYDEITKDQVEEFKKRNNLEGKPIVYLGNPQIKKGFLDAYESTKNFDAHLVCTGEGELKSLARHLKLSFKDYLILLKASDLVLTMSIFKEGWCRVAHEAMLLGTPVIGSGLGGMGELLMGAGGKVCNDKNLLGQLVIDHLQGKKNPSLNQDYLRQFTFEKYKQDWSKILIKMNIK